MVPQPDAEHEDQRARGDGDAKRWPTGEWLVTGDVSDHMSVVAAHRDLFRAVASVNRQLEEAAWKALGGR